jgi:hypothetical protein
MKAEAARIPVVTGSRSENARHNSTCAASPGGNHRHGIRCIRDVGMTCLPCSGHAGVSSGARRWPHQAKASAANQQQF